MGNQINGVVARLRAGDAAEYSCDIHSSSVRMVSGPIPATLARDLEAVASLHKCDPACLAGELLAAAIQDAIAELPEGARKQLGEIKAAHDAAETEAQREALSWDPGRT